MTVEPVTLRFLETHPADGARALEALGERDLSAFVSALPALTAARVLAHMTPDARAACLRALGEQAAPIVAHLPVAIAAPALRTLSPSVSRRVLAALPRVAAVPIGLALRYPQGTVGAVVDPHAATVRPEMTVAETIQIARRAPERLRRYVYVLDGAQKLVGVLDVRECVVGARKSPVRSLMLPDPVSLRARTSLADAAAHEGWHRFDVLPVVDRLRVFVGVARRRALEAALSAEDPSGDSGGTLPSAVIDLANLYWQASSALLLGPRDEGGERR